MKRRVIAMAWAVLVGAVVMLVVGFYDPWIGYLAGTGVGCVVCAWWLVRLERKA